MNSHDIEKDLNEFTVTCKINENIVLHQQISLVSTSENQTVVNLLDVCLKKFTLKQKSKKQDLDSTRDIIIEDSSLKKLILMSNESNLEFKSKTRNFKKNKKITKTSSDDK